MYMSIRKIFGTLVPGFALVAVLALIFNEAVGAFVLRYAAFSDKAFLYASVILLSYLLGALNIQIFFRFLDIVGGWLDRWTAEMKSAGVRDVVKFFSEKFHIFDLRTLSDETRTHFLSDIPSEEKDEYESRYWAAKMLVLRSSPALAKEAMEIEGDINFCAGMFLPLILFSIFYRPIWPLGALAIFVAIFFFLRFEHLRHDDVIFVARAAGSIKDDH
jgi:hypothetical protein